jgi:hypothetical protein
MVENLLHQGKDFNEETDVLPESMFFPQNPNDDNDIIYINTGYWDKMYKRYERIADFRKACNMFILHPDTHQKYQERIPNLMTNAASKGEFWNVEIIGGPGSGKSMFMRGYLIPTHAIKVRKNFIVHCDIEGLENYFYVDMIDVLEDLMIHEPDPAVSQRYADFISKYRSNFVNNQPFDVFVTYNESQTDQVTKTLFKSQDVGFQDESPKMHGKGSKISRDNLDNILGSCARALNLNFGFIAQFFIPIETVHYYIRIIGYIKSRKVTVAALTVYDDNHEYYVGIAEFQLYDIKGLSEYYERVSREKKRELKELAGFAAYKPNKQEKKDLINQLVEEVISDMENNGITTASLNYVASVASDNQKINANIERQNIISSAYRIIKGQSDEDGDNPKPGRPSKKAKEKSEDTLPKNEQVPAPVYIGPTDDFVVTRQMLEAIVNGMNLKEPRQGQYYLDSLDKSMPDVAVSHGVTEGAISQVWTKINAVVCPEIGRIYEKWYAEWLVAHKDALKIKDVVHDGTPSREDITVEYLNGSFDIISVKWRNPHPGKPSFSIGIGELNPEIIKARTLINAGNNARVVLHVRIKGKQKTMNDIVNFESERKYFSYKISDFE